MTTLWTNTRLFQLSPFSSLGTAQLNLFWWYVFLQKKPSHIAFGEKLNSSQHKHSDLPEKNKNKKAQSEAASRRLCFESDTWVLFTWQHLGKRKKSSRWLMQWNTDVMHPNGCITKPPFHIQLKGYVVWLDSLHWDDTFELWADLIQWQAWSWHLRLSDIHF